MDIYDRGIGRPGGAYDACAGHGEVVEGDAGGEWAEVIPDRSKSFEMKDFEGRPHPCDVQVVRLNSGVGEGSIEYFVGDLKRRVPGRRGKRVTGFVTVRLRPLRVREKVGEHTCRGKGPYARHVSRDIGARPAFGTRWRGVCWVFERL